MGIRRGGIGGHANRHRLHDPRRPGICSDMALPKPSLSASPVSNLTRTDRAFAQHEYLFDYPFGRQLRNRVLKKGQGPGVVALAPEDFCTRSREKRVRA